MSVLIKGMDKETAMRLCSYAGIWMEEEDFIEIPPHGRLIDADKMVGDLLTVDPQFEGMIKWSITVVEAQPTIIEAEGGE